MLFHNSKSKVLLRHTKTCCSSEDVVWVCFPFSCTDNCPFELSRLEEISMEFVWRWALRYKTAVLSRGSVDCNDTYKCKPCEGSSQKKHGTHSSEHPFHNSFLDEVCSHSLELLLHIFLFYSFIPFFEWISSIFHVYSVHSRYHMRHYHPLRALIQEQTSQV